jgi:hypothetical protein
VPAVEEVNYRVYYDSQSIVMLRKSWFVFAFQFLQEQHTVRQISCYVVAVEKSTLLSEADRVCQNAE